MKIEALKIKRLPIEIQVVRVGNRQMTKSVFTQLPKDIYDILSIYRTITKTEEYGEINILGWVNYLPADFDYMKYATHAKELVEDFPYSGIHFSYDDDFASILLMAEYNSTIWRSYAPTRWAIHEFDQLFIAT